MPLAFASFAFAVMQKSEERLVIEEVFSWADTSNAFGGGLISRSHMEIAQYQNVEKAHLERAFARFLDTLQFGFKPHKFARKATLDEIPNCPPDLVLFEFIEHPAESKQGTGDIFFCEVAEDVPAKWNVSITSKLIV